MAVSVEIALQGKGMMQYAPNFLSGGEKIEQNPHTAGITKMMSRNTESTGSVKSENFRSVTPSDNLEIIKVSTRNAIDATPNLAESGIGQKVAIWG